ncbi:MAG: heme-binding protein [Planctomycetes bacterium]|nr:heme-binding protein [Planctomycetota bacterium]
MNRFVATLSLLAVAAPAQLRLLELEDLSARRTGAAVLGFGLQAYATDHDATGVQRLRAAIATAAECLPLGSAARVAADALRSQTGSTKALAAAAEDLRADLAFVPVAEAELPEGVPGFTALDEVELRDYPTYRMVRTHMKGGSLGAFWPLFRHIQSHEIAMTTPVQIDYRADGERLRQDSMAFLYGSTGLGTPGKEGNVEVVDVPATTVLSIGSRGYDQPTRIAEMTDRLRSWLAANPAWQATGPVRVMGYNSPSVPANKRCFEVQLPVRRGAAARLRESV